MTVAVHPCEWMTGDTVETLRLCGQPARIGVDSNAGERLWCCDVHAAVFDLDGRRPIEPMPARSLRPRRRCAAVTDYCDVCGGPHAHNHRLGRLRWAARTARHAKPRTFTARLRLLWHDLVLHGLLDKGTERCQDCGRAYASWWCDDQALWNGLMDGDGGLLCSSCFERLARRSSVG